MPASADHACGVSARLRHLVGAARRRGSCSTRRRKRDVGASSPVVPAELPGGEHDYQFERGRVELGEPSSAAARDGAGIVSLAATERAAEVDLEFRTDVIVRMTPRYAYAIGVASGSSLG